MKCEVLRPEAFPFVVCDLAAGETILARTGAMTAAEGAISLDSTGSEMALDGYDYLMSEDMFLLQKITASKAARVYLTHVAPGEVRVMELVKGDSWIVNRRNFLAASSDLALDRRPEDLTELAGVSALQISGPGTLILGGFGSILDLSLQKGESYEVDAGQLAAWQAPERDWRSRERERIRIASAAAASSGESYLAHFDGPAEVLIQSGRADS